MFVGLSHGALGLLVAQRQITTAESNPPWSLWPATAYSVAGRLVREQALLVSHSS